MGKQQRFQTGGRGSGSDGFSSEHVQELLKLTPSLKVVAQLVGAGFMFYLIKNSYIRTDAGITYVLQNSLTGELRVFTEPGIHFRLPFFTQVTSYKQVITASFGEEGGNSTVMFSQKEAVRVRFADTYVGLVPCTFRFRLSSDPDQIRQMHKDFRSETRLSDTLLARNCRNVVIITATQYTGEEFFQGGLNEFKQKLEDQLKDGIYMTERKQVTTSSMSLAPLPKAPANGGSAEDEASREKLRAQQQMVWKTVNVLDKSGMPIRTETPLEQYGITVTQVTVGDPKPENLLDKLLVDKKKLVGARIKAVQEQETAKEQSKTEQLKKEIVRTKAVQDAQREKELSIIQQQRDVEVAKQIAMKEKVEQTKLKELAVIDKMKELEIAQANMNIFKADSEAALFEAKAIRAKGEAEAAVTAAKYKALGANKEIYLAEVKRDTAKMLYQNLQNFKVEMPKNYIGGSNSGSSTMTSNLDIITGLAALGMMDKAEAKAQAGASSSSSWFGGSS